MEKTITIEQLQRHEQFVRIFREAKQRKREWQHKVDALLSEREERVSRRRAEIDALFED